MNNKPSPALLSLKDSLESGTLQPLDRARVRALLSCADSKSAIDAQRVISLLVSRVAEYFGVTQYVSPGYVFGKTASEYPESLSKERSWDSRNGQWYQQRICVEHPTEGPQAVWQQASHLCLMTAFRVAAWEMETLAPEATMLLRICSTSAYFACTSREIGGVRWYESRRRLGTPGIRKLLAQSIENLPQCAVAINDIHPIVIPASQISLLYQLMARDAERAGKLLSWAAPLLAVA